MLALVHVLHRQLICLSLALLWPASRSNCILVFFLLAATPKHPSVAVTMTDIKAEEAVGYGSPSQGSVSNAAELDWTRQEELKARRKSVSHTIRLLQGP